jgi:hypothetical protein
MLGVLDLDTTAYGSGDSGQVAWVGADDEVAAPEGAFDDAGVNDVSGAGTAGEGSSGPGPGVIEGFDVAAGQEPGELGLAGGASPALGDDRSRHGRYDAAE